MNTQQSWELAKLRRESTAYRLENAQLRADLQNVRDVVEPYDAGGDVICGRCDLSLGDYYEMAGEYRFCPFCGCKLEWGEYWAGVSADA